MQAIVKIFAFIGFVTILIYLSFRLWDYFKNQSEKADKAKIRPPLDYMNDVGIKCPDYWVNTGVTDDGAYICKNVNGIEVSKSASDGCSAVNCNISGDDSTVYFDGVASGKTWEHGDPNGLKTLSDSDRNTFVKTNVKGTASRCDWIKCCGAYNDPATNTSNSAVWLGVSDVCNSANASEAL
jgi:hypothetical protein